ncbi:MAG: OmpH family outer membrane protein [Bacteroidetes bacterium]|nr:OmpH family outer membrane protein [Bacteroidota bacterium]
METENIQNENPQIQKENTANSCEQKKCRCCLNLILNIVSIIGIIILFILYFTGNPSTSGRTKQTGKSALAIGFINSDSIMAGYDLVKKMKSNMEIKQKEAEDNFSVQQKTFESQVATYQKKVKDNSLSITEAQNQEKILMQKQQSLLELKDELTQKLSLEEMNINILLQDSIMNFLKRYNKKYNYDYVLGFSKGSGILFANDSLEITKEFLEALNKEYKENNKDK